MGTTTRWARVLCRLALRTRRRTAPSRRTRRRSSSKHTLQKDRTNWYQEEDARATLLSKVWTPGLENRVRIVALPVPSKGLKSVELCHPRWCEGLHLKRTTRIRGE